MRPVRTFFGLAWKILLILVFVLSLSDLLFNIFSIKITHRGGPLREENYDPALARLNSMNKLESYVDSLQARSGRTDSAAYPAILSETVRDRLYHGYLTYEPDNNFIAWLSGTVTGRSYDAIVEGDQILKYSEADCRQQCLVMMEALRNKGYSVRAITMKTMKYSQGHFTFETFYNGSWHFFDPDLEPDAKMLTAANRPSMERISGDAPLIKQLYNRQDTGMIVDLLRSNQYGNVNELIPARLYMFHKVTRFLSNYAWIGCLLIFFFAFRGAGKKEKAASRKVKLSLASQSV